MPRSLVLLLAFAAGQAVAGTFYAQPLLDEIAAGFGIAERSAGAVIAVTQVGYAAGLVLLVPLGDVVERRRLILVQLVLGALALAAAGAAGSGAQLFAAMAGVGLFAVVIQLLVVHAASLTPEAHRGQVMGAVTSGVVLGILQARDAGRAPRRAGELAHGISDRRGPDAVGGPGAASPAPAAATTIAPQSATGRRSDRCRRSTPKSDRFASAVRWRCSSSPPSALCGAHSSSSSRLHRTRSHTPPSAFSAWCRSPARSPRAAPGGSPTAERVSAPPVSRSACSSSRGFHLRRSSGRSQLSPWAWC